MANRALAAKADRARLQRIEAGHGEFTKPVFLIQSRIKAELVHIAQCCDGVTVQRCDAAVARGAETIGKGKRRLARGAVAFKLTAGAWSRAATVK